MYILYYIFVLVKSGIAQSWIVYNYIFQFLCKVSQFRIFPGGHWWTEMMIICDLFGISLNYEFPNAPSELYTTENAVKTIELATKIIDIVDDTYFSN
jgi:hypothetical protein